MKVIVMIPARMGSQRLKKKNLRELDGVPLITRAVRKSKASGVFDEIWVNSEHPVFGDIAMEEGVHFHKRPAALGSNEATSEQYVAEFLEQHRCDFVVQVHSIAPLLSVAEVRSFVNALRAKPVDCLLSVDEIRLECAFRDEPVNFSYAEKTNSQSLEPIQRISWSISAWRRSTYLAAVRAGCCATYSGKVGFHTISPLAALVIKTEKDLQVAQALLPLIQDKG